ncbi:MAG: stage II sporulation protein P [Bacillota bacterium]|uniref:stage II sporulation protein P n=1 Tax=Virgibacillus TaxID=84406 RepID=UPI00047BCD7E|nr:MULTISPECIES: stage II sporulation protein P [Bacillaceae]MCC2248416.1 stage II sporulation protein P [Virgibacillus sp. AGTR]MDY7043151.1 stage II sporulation protein P [Virgibacillus sp. M23]QRZ16720.1 stage II sporulation protein P [Virgibacillus sp. AGTR]WBX79789.1 stage II sporulation protein P [Virgibacillus salarius]
MNLKNTLLTSVISTVILLLLVAFMTLPKIHADLFHVPLISKITESTIFSDALLFIMSTEIPQLDNHLEENGMETPKFSRLLFEGTSGITPNNFNSLLNLELPGLTAYSNNIYTAGADKNSTNIPMESPPPDFEDLLKEDSNNKKTEQPNEESDDKDNAEIFIYHSHSWEAFLPLLGDSKKKPSDASSTDNSKNIVMVGSLLTEQLEKQGITTFHDTTNVTAELHKKGWDYYDSYKYSRQTIEEVMASNNHVNYLIDIHRDAQRKEKTTINVHGKNYAKLYFIVGVEHKKYKENLKFVEALNDRLKEKYPGISRGIYLKDKSEGNGIYNQDLSAKSILIEVGGVDNNKEELSNTTEALAEVISDYHMNAEKVNADG